MTFLGGIQNVCLLTEEHVPSIRNIFRDLWSCTTIFDSETCIWAIIRLKDNLRVLIICAV